MREKTIRKVELGFREKRGIWDRSEGQRRNGERERERKKRLRESCSQRGKLEAGGPPLYKEWTDVAGCAHSRCGDGKRKLVGSMSYFVDRKF